MSELEAIIKQIFELSPPALLIVLLVGLGWAIKQSPVPNWLIPWILVLVGAFVFPTICDRQAIVYNAYNPTVSPMSSGPFWVSPPEAFTNGC